MTGELHMSALPPAAWLDVSFTSQDGLRLYARHYPAVAASSGRRPVLCLPGLTRNSRDFHDVAQVLSTDPIASRDVYTLDSRGRGASDQIGRAHV